MFRYPFLLGAIQVVEADPTQADRIIDALYKFVTLANNMLQNNGQGLEQWGKARWKEFVIVLQWYAHRPDPTDWYKYLMINFDRLYDFYPNGQEEMLLNMMRTLKATGVSWDAVFAPEVRRTVIITTSTPH